MELFSGTGLAHLIEVFGVNLVLSGDNAVVIAMAVRTLEGTNRRRAVLWGAAELSVRAQLAYLSSP